MIDLSYPLALANRMPQQDTETLRVNLHKKARWKRAFFKVEPYFFLHSGLLSFSFFEQSTFLSSILPPP
jgi:hypothetical protein